MKRNFLFTLLLVLTLGFVSCKTKSEVEKKPLVESTEVDNEEAEVIDENGIEEPKTTTVYDRLAVDQKAMVDFWKADVNGCNRYRDAENASTLAKMLQDMKANETEVATLLGPPEENAPSGPFHVYGYYFDGQCDGQKLRPGTVYCLLQIYFDAKTSAWHTGTVVCG